MEFEIEAARLIAEAIAADIRAAQAGADEYDERVRSTLDQLAQPPAPLGGCGLDLDRAFDKFNAECIRDLVDEIAVLKRVSEQFPELAQLANGLMGHFQVNLEQFMEIAERDSQRLAALQG